MSKNAKEIISKMALEEKADLCSGIDMWHTKAIEQLGIPSITMTDGPHGLRKQKGDDWLAAVPATCFPSGAGLACSWDRELVQKVGQAIAEECQEEDISILLGPALNIKRSPLCGRNFEYYSEDPYLTGEMAAGFITGVQKEGVGACPKHFAVNNQEHQRFTVNSVLDDRTLREIYLTGFEMAVKQAKPWALMAAYNRINGTFCTENKYLLTDILRDEWGHDGIVMSDWGAVNDREKALAAGLDLEMPSSGGYGSKRIIDAVKNGELEESVLDKVAERMLTIIFKAAENHKIDYACDKQSHHALAAEAASQCFVLLKNKGNLLPLKGQTSIAVIGGFAKAPRYQGGGSSHIHPTQVESPLEAIKSVAGDLAQVYYSDGYLVDHSSSFDLNRFSSVSDKADDQLIADAKTIAQKADVAVIFAGLPENYESEGYDRKHMQIPEGHQKLIEAVASVQKNTVVVLNNGAAIEMPWIDKVSAVIEAYLGGQAFGKAIADVLFGKINPSGKLAETFPKQLEDTPTYMSCPGDVSDVEYREGIFVGYRYYEAKKIEPLFPFGFGLSYTTFAYDDLSVDKKTIKDDEIIEVKINVKNTGNLAGKEIVQLYVSDLKSSVLRPNKELKGFEKVTLAPGESKQVLFKLDKRAFSYYDIKSHAWITEAGEFDLLIGSSSADIRLRSSVHVEPVYPPKVIVTKNSTLEEVAKTQMGAVYIQQMFAKFADSPLLAGTGDSPALDPASALTVYGDTILRSLALLSPELPLSVIDQLVDQLNQ